MKIKIYESKLFSKFCILITLSPGLPCSPPGPCGPLKPWKKHLFNINKKLNSNGRQYNKQWPYDQLTRVFCKTSNSNCNGWHYNQSKQKKTSRKICVFLVFWQIILFLPMTLIFLLMKKEFIQKPLPFLEFFFGTWNPKHTYHTGFSIFFKSTSTSLFADGTFYIKIWPIFVNILYNSIKIRRYQRPF